MLRFLPGSLLLSLACFTPAMAQPVITTAAGGGPHDVPALTAPIWPMWLTTDPSGNVYFTSYRDHVIFRIDPNGLLTVAAGTGIELDRGDGSSAAEASFLLPSSLDSDPAGNLFVHGGGESSCFDEPCPFYFRGEFRIRRIDAVTGTVGSITQEGQPVRVTGDPADLKVDDHGEVFVSTSSPGCPGFYNVPSLGSVYKVDPNSGARTHVAGDLGAIFGGPLGDGGPATGAYLPNGPSLAFDAAGDLLLSDLEHDRIRVVNLGTGIIGTYAGSGIEGCAGDGGPALAAEMFANGGIDSDAGGNLFISDSCSRVRRVDAGTGIITTVAGNGVPGYSGDGGPATSANITGGGVHVDDQGNLYLWSEGRIRKVDAATQIIATIAGNPGANYFGVGFFGNGGPAGQARIRWPVDVAVAPDGDMYIADAGYGQVRRVDGATGVISAFHPAIYTVAPDNPPSLSGLAVHPGGDFFTVYHSTFSDIGPLGSNEVVRTDPNTGAHSIYAGQWYPGFGGDGGPASQAIFWEPRAIAFDASSNLYVADTGNNRIRRIDGATGTITTFAGGGSGALGDGLPATQATLASPTGVAVDPFGNVLIADTGHYRVRRVDAFTGVITTTGGVGVGGFSGDGGPATAARLTADRIAADAAGNIYLSGGERVRRIDAGTGIITTVAGDGVLGFKGDGEDPTAARLGVPEGLSLDASGALFIAGYESGRVRRVASAPPGVNHPPVAVASVTGACVAGGSAAYLLDGGASSDPDSSAGTSDDIVLYEWFDDYATSASTLLGSGAVVNATLPLGPHLFTLRVTDRAGAARVAQVQGTIVDTTAPAISLRLDPTVLWPPNHQIVDISAAVAASDDCGDAAVVLDAIASSEPDDAPGSGDGNTQNDVQDAAFGTADFAFSLRAERATGGAGRSYAVTYRAVDASGNSSTATSIVSVPHDRSGIVDPVSLTVEETAAGTRIRWLEVPGAHSYNVVRGAVGSLTMASDAISLGDVRCFTGGTLATSTEGDEDGEAPAPGSAYFYLVEYVENGRASTFGSDGVLKPREPGSGGCP